MSVPQILPTVAGQQQKPRGIAWKAVPPPHLSLCDDNLSPDYQYQGNGAGISPSGWGVDENIDVTPAYAKFVFEDFEKLEIPSGVSIMEDNNGVLMIEILPNNPFSQTVQRRPFNYEPFSDPGFPFNFLPYPEELLVEDNRVSEGSHPGQPPDSAMIFVARVSVANSEAGAFAGSLDCPTNVDLPGGLGEPLREIDLLTSEDI
ncbi:hypothetical protein JOM56_002663 [Amanita muscaria]